MLRNISLTLATIILSSFTLCQEKCRQELIFGKWIMDKNVHGQAQMAMDFTKAKTVTVDRIINGQSTFKKAYNYKLTGNEQYLLLKPLDSSQKTWKIRIIELDKKNLTLRSQSPDSSLLILKRQPK